MEITRVSENSLLSTGFCFNGYHHPSYSKLLLVVAEWD